MIRALTDIEQATIRERQLCPFCGRSTSELTVRARGGLSANMYCPCGAGFNLASFQGKYIVAELIAEPTGPPEKERWCECEHPLSWHSDVDGHCKAPVGYDFSDDCSCEEFKEAQGDTLENLGVDVL